MSGAPGHEGGLRVWRPTSDFLRRPGGIEPLHVSGSRARFCPPGSLAEFPAFRVRGTTGLLRFLAPVGSRLRALIAAGWFSVGSRVRPHRPALTGHPAARARVVGPLPSQGPPVSDVLIIRAGLRRIWVSPPPFRLALTLACLASRLLARALSLARSLALSLSLSLALSLLSLSLSLSLFLSRSLSLALSFSRSLARSLALASLSLFLSLSRPHFFSVPV